MSITSFTSTQLYQDFLGNFPSRKLLLHNPLNQNLDTALAPVPDTGNSSLNGNVLMVLSVLICGIICSLGLHYIIRCALRCTSSFIMSEPFIANPSSSGGSANTGIKQKALKTFPVVTYSPDMNLPGLGEECVICLSDFAPGERLRLLPKCNHGFHVRCIDKWLKLHSSCAKCRHCLIETCQKIIGSNQADLPASASTVTAPESISVRIAPLEPEGRVNNRRGSS